MDYWRIRVRIRQIKKSTIVGIQLAALLLLQVYSSKPIFGLLIGPNNHSAVCQGDHRLCGCSPEKIANRTCCCFRYKSFPKACHLKMYCECESKSSVKPETSRGPRLVCYPSCGGQPNLITASFERFLPIKFNPDLFNNLLFYYHLVFREDFQGRSKEPPDPPPKITAIS